MEYKEGVMDRIKQSFALYKSNFLNFTLPLFLYNLLSMVLLLGGVVFIISLFLGKTVPSIGTFIVLGILFILIFITYLVFFIPVFNCTIKTIKDAANGEKIDLKANFSYAMKHFGGMIMVYWYVFLYVMLIPVIILMIGLILIALGSYGVGGIILTIGGFVYIGFAIYRGLKSLFSVYNAIDKNNYSKENFYEYMKITDSKLLRIFGNFVVYAIIVWLVMLVIGIILNTLGLGVSSISDGLKDFKNINTFIENYSFFGSLIGNIINTFISSITTTFGFVFVYIFYKRLDFEYAGNKKVETKENTKIEKNDEL